MEPVIARFDSPADAERANREYYRRLSPAARLDILLELIALARPEDHATAERLERVYRIVPLGGGGS